MKAIRQEGRVNQKRRTRMALIATATELVATGAVPTIPEVADAAGISRATAYRYFSSQEAMLLEAMLERAMPEIDQVVRAWDASHDAATRLDQLVQAIFGVVIAYDASFRAMLRASLEPEAAQGRVRRGGRIRWLNQALEPVRDRFLEADFERLVNALALYIGIEPLVVLCDIVGLTPEQATDTARWAAAGLLRAALDEADSASASD